MAKKQVEVIVPGHIGGVYHTTGSVIELEDRQVRYLQGRVADVLPAKPKKKGAADARDEQSHG